MSSADDHLAEDAFPGGPTTYATRDMLRALAHPLRMQLLQRLGGRGTARAADLAADLGVPANSVSYHLRILAKGGAIVEAPEAARDKRDRRSEEHTSELQSGGQLVCRLLLEKK